MRLRRASGRARGCGHGMSEEMRIGMGMRGRGMEMRTAEARAQAPCVHARVLCRGAQGREGEPECIYGHKHRAPWGSGGLAHSSCSMLDFLWSVPGRGPWAPRVGANINVGHWAMDSGSLRRPLPIMFVRAMRRARERLIWKKAARASMRPRAMRSRQTEPAASPKNLTGRWPQGGAVGLPGIREETIG